MRTALAVALTALVLLALACQTVEEELAGLATPAPDAAPSPSPQPTAAPTATVIPVTGWATFTNTAYGYSIDYPADWLIDPYGRRDETTSEYVDIFNYQPPPVQGPSPPPGAFAVEIVALANKAKLPLDQWVADFRAAAITPTTVLSSETQEMNGVTAIRQVTSFYGRGKPGLSAFFAAGGYVILINGPEADSPLLAVYERMLASVRVQP